MKNVPSLEAAEKITKKIALGHYENFPVGSILIPKRSRQHFYNLYAYMRTADDYADDEGRTVEERLKLLGDWRKQLEASFTKEPVSHPVFIALQRSIAECKLSKKPLERLLEAFTFDVYDRPKFYSEDDLAWYTQRSAAPVGELVLALFGYRDSKRIKLSDDICSALQLINFIQDAKEDLERDRCYFPSAELPQNLQSAPAVAMLHDRALRKKIIKIQLLRATELLGRGEELPGLVTGRLRFELRAIVIEAHLMIRKIEKLGYDTLDHRPKISKLEYARALARAIF